MIRALECRVDANGQILVRPPRVTQTNSPSLIPSEPVENVGRIVGMGPTGICGYPTVLVEMEQESPSRCPTCDGSGGVPNPSSDPRDPDWLPCPDPWHAVPQEDR
jgi:hypothetical protein